jgi:hypothetical protein
MEIAFIYAQKVVRRVNSLQWKSTLCIEKMFGTIEMSSKPNTQFLSLCLRFLTLAGITTPPVLHMYMSPQITGSSE